MEPKGLLPNARRQRDLYDPHPLSDITNIAQSGMTTTETGISLRHKTWEPSIHVTTAILYNTIIYYPKRYAVLCRERGSNLGRLPL